MKLVRIVDPFATTLHEGWGSAAGSWPSVDGGSEGRDSLCYDSAGGGPVFGGGGLQARSPSGTTRSGS